MVKDVVVIGASVGGIEALRTIVAELPKDFSASLFVVIHTSADSPGVLGGILERAGPLPVVTVSSASRVQPGVIYVPVPDYHMIIEPGLVRATRGPKENRFRPAIDPLFRSAASVYGPAVIGVILTGRLDDGAAGLWAVKQLGGTAVVQDPSDATAPSMPESALRYVRVDHCVPLAEIPSLLVRLTQGTTQEVEVSAVPEQMKIEVEIAKEGRALEAGVLELGTPSAFTCPECHGVLLALKDGKRTRFRCHTGHAYSAESLLAEITEGIDDALWNAIRIMEEGTMLMDQFAEHLRSDQQQQPVVEQLGRQAAEVKERINLVRRAVLES